MTTNNRRGRGESTAVDEALPVSTMGADEGFEFDFTVVKDMEPVPDAKEYLCLLTKMEFGKAASGHQKCTVEATVTEPAYYQDRILTADFSMQPQARYRMLNFLVSLGEDPEAVKVPNFKIIPSKYLGSALVVISRNEIYDEQERSKIRRTKHASIWEPWVPSEDPGEAGEEEAEKAAF